MSAAPKLRLVGTEGCCRPEGAGKCTQREIKRLATFESKGTEGVRIQLRITLSERTLPSGEATRCILNQTWIFRDGAWQPCCRKCFGLMPDAVLVGGTS